MAREPMVTSTDSDLHKLSSPQVTLLTMVIFLIIAGFVVLILSRQVSTAFQTNPGLNGLIVGVLVVGIFLAIGQVVRLFREVRWVNSLRTGEDYGREPVLLAPMKTLLARSQATALSTSALRSILDSLATRLDESRDIARYLTGLLVFLGLLGTFWGLLQTIGSIGTTIQTLEPSAADSRDFLDSLKAGLQAPLAGMGTAFSSSLFGTTIQTLEPSAADSRDFLDSLKAGLQAPLAGMGTAFSSSLFGLAGSLVLGFLDLQAGRAQNRFYVELENWLATLTDLNSDLGLANAPKIEPATSEEFRALAKQLAAMQEGGGTNQRTTAAMASLADGIAGLVKNMRGEQQMLRDWVESQAADNKAMRDTLEKIAALIAAQNRGQ